jgi:hypothetical protein
MKETTVVFMCRKPPIANSDSKAYNDRCFELALPSLQFVPHHLKGKHGSINFKSLELAQTHVRGQGLLAIYQVTIPTLHIETINTTTGTVTINPTYRLKLSNIERMYCPVMLGKDTFVKHSLFNIDEINNQLLLDMTNGLETKRVGYPKKVESSDPNAGKNADGLKAAPDASTSTNGSKGCSFI